MTDRTRMVLVTGLSGSGRSAALKAIEDMEFYCVDNLPLTLLTPFVDFAERSEETFHWAIGVDVREKGFIEQFPSLYETLKADGHRVELLFLEASDQTLVRRFSETRRPHPLSRGGTPLDGIRLERSALDEVRTLADRTLDTSGYTVHDLRSVVELHYAERDARRPMAVTIVTFGYKYGTPYDLDLLFDLRFLPNPHFVPELRPLTGEDVQVRDYIMGRSESEEFFSRLLGFLEYLLPRYKREGKSYLTIGFGCTGGKHRSITIGLLVTERLKQGGYEVSIRHRDREK